MTESEQAFEVSYKMRRRFPERCADGKLMELAKKKDKAALDVELGNAITMDEATIRMDCIKPRENQVANAIGCTASRFAG